MRAIRVIAVGAVILVGLLQLITFGDGLVEASAIMLAPFVVAITVGGAVGVAVSASGEQPGRPVRRPGKRQRCGLCSRHMTGEGHLWICVTCDGIA